MFELKIAYPKFRKFALVFKDKYGRPSNGRKVHSTRI
jgi:hypothetical protein